MVISPRFSFFTGTLLCHELSIVNYCECAARALRGTKTAGDTLKWRRQLVMIAHKITQTFTHADETAHTYLFIQSHNAVCGSFKRHYLTHFLTDAALVAHRYGKAAPVACRYSYSAFISIRDLVICL